METSLSDDPAPTIRQALEALNGQLEALAPDAQRALAGLLDGIRQAGEAQEAQALRYRTLFEAEPRAHLVTDAEGVILEANRSAARLLGVSQEALVGKPLLKFVAEEMRPVFLMRLGRQLAIRPPARVDGMTLDLMLHPAAGEPFPASIAAEWLSLPDGQPIGWGWVIYDITMHRLVEEALAMSEARLTLALEAAREGLYDYGVASGQVYFSPTFYTSLGYSPGDFPASFASLKRLIHPDEWPVAQKVFEENVGERGNTHSIEFRMQAKSGEWRWMVGQGKVIERDAAGQAVRIVGTTRDITERKEAEAEIRRLNADLEARVRERTTEYEAAIARLENQIAKNFHVELELRASEEQYRTLVETSPDSIIVTDLQAEVLMVNTQTLTLFEYASAQEMTGQSGLTFLAPADRPRALNHLQQVLDSGQRQGAEYSAQKETGASFDAELSVSLVRKVNGAPEGFIIITRDVTERKRMEAEVRRLNEVLERRVVERTRELEALYKVMSLGGELLDLPTMLQQSLALVLETVGCQAGVVHLLEDGDGTPAAGKPVPPDLRLAASQGLPEAVAAGLERLPVSGGLMSRVAQQGESLVSLDLTAEAEALGLPALGDFHAYVGAPMRGRGRRTVGVLGVFSRGDLKVSVEAVALLTTIADQMGSLVETARLRRQAEMAAVIEERQRLARELHDSVTQALYSLSLIATAGKSLVQSGNLKRLEEHLTTIDETAQLALRQMRLLIHALRPLILEQVGLAEAIRQRLSAVEARVGLQAMFSVEGQLEMPPALESELYSIAQEALNNVLKHAQATSVTVRLAQSADGVELEIGDDGRGFDPAQAALGGGLGLTSLRERVKKLGGQLTISSTPGGGSQVWVRVPRGG